MTIPRQLAPTVGLAHGGFEFLKGSFEGLKGYTVGRMTKSRRSKLYIDNAGWGPEVDSIEYGYRVPLVGFMFSSARSTDRNLSRTSAPTSPSRLGMRDMPRFNPAGAAFSSVLRKVRSLWKILHLGGDSHLLR